MRLRNILSAPLLLIAAALLPGPLRGELVSCQRAKIHASDGARDAVFGRSAAIDADLLVVGATDAADKYDHLGAAYLFRRGQGGVETWGEVVRVVPSDQGAYLHFGESVAISGDTFVVGAATQWGHAAYSGRAYVFQRNAGGADAWGEVALLAPIGVGSDQRFGWSVAIDGDTVVVGAWGVGGEGAAYVFERHGGGPDGWGQVAVLSPPGLSSGDRFGWSVAIEGDTAVVGAPQSSGFAGAAYVFDRSAGGPEAWGQVARVTGVPYDRLFGTSVDVERNRIAVGAPRVNYDNVQGLGSAHLFERHWGGADAWGRRAHLLSSDLAWNDSFGVRVALDGDVVIVSAEGEDNVATNSGSAYLFRRNHGGADAWGQVAKFVAFDPWKDDWFGHGLAAGGGIIAFGALGDDDVGPGSGSVYIFNYTSANWQEQAEATAPVAVHGDNLGFTVALDGDLLSATSSEADNELGWDVGPIHLFERNTGGADAWQLVAKVSPAGLLPDSSFGRYGVALEGARLIAGAPHNMEAAYIFERIDSSTWTEVAKLEPADPSTTALGWGVDLSGNLAAVGGYPAAVLFRQDEGGTGAWGEIVQLTASDSDVGQAVAVDGDHAAVGRGWGRGPAQSVLKVHLFGRNEGGPDQWGEITQLIDPSGNGEKFGFVLDLDHDTLVVGAPDVTAGGVFGKAHVYERNEGGMDAWGLVATLSAGAPEPEDRFGSSVAITGHRIVIGAPMHGGTGALYVFERDLGGRRAWGQAARITGSSAGAGDAFGAAVALSAQHIAGGAPLDDEGSTLNRGVVHVFDRDLRFCPPPPADPGRWWTGNGDWLDAVGGTAAAPVGATFTGGISGQAFDFDGSDDHVVIPHSDSLDVGAGDFSLTFWLRSSQTTGIGTVFDKRDGPPLTGYHAFLYNGSLGVQLADGSGHTNFVGPSLVADGTFHFVAVTVDRDAADGGTIFLDGVQDLGFNPTGRQGNLSTAVEARLGRHSDATGGGYYLDGALDEFQIYRRALSSQEVQALFAHQRSCSDSLELRHQDVVGDTTFTACDQISTGSDFRAASGVLTLRAGRSVGLGDGFSVASGAGLRVEIEPILIKD